MVVPDGTGDVRDAGDMHAIGGKRAGSVRTDVSKSLNDNGPTGNGPAEFVKNVRCKESDSMTGGAGATTRTLQAERFASDDRGNEVAGVSRVGIGHPRHGLLVSSHVRCHDVGIGADEWNHLHGKSAGEPFEFACGHAARIASDAAFAATERQVHQRAFPGHPHGEGGDFSEIHGRVVTQAALDWTARQVVLDPVAEEHFSAAIIAVDRHGDSDPAFRPFAAFTQILGKIEKLGDLVKLFRCHRKHRIPQKIITHGMNQHQNPRIAHIEMMNAQGLTFPDCALSIFIFPAMTREIVQYGHPILRQRCRAVDEVNDTLIELVGDMLDTMVSAHGVGLAAPQVGEDLRLAVIDVSHDPECISFLKVNGEDANLDSIMPLIFINPELTLGQEKEISIEGCLSIKGIRAEVRRPMEVKAILPQLDGSVLEIETDGLLARALQHEIDHLNGVLFVDRLSAVSKVSVKNRLKRLLEENEQV